MDRFAALAAFAAVVEAGSFVRAAERLGTSTSTLSRQIAELEQHLGARLLNRTTRKLSLTESGQAFYERAVQLLADLEEAEAMVSSAAATPRGTVRLTCSHAMGVQRVGPAIASFVARYPEVRFEVSVSDRIVDLVEEGFDLALRIGQVGSEQLVARRLGTTRLLACAAPAYLKARGTPRTPADLAAHAAITYAYAPNPRLWRLTDRQGHTHEVRVSGPLHANSGDLAVAAAIRGLGIVLEPDFLVGGALAAGLLVRVLPEYEGVPADIWAVYPSRRHLSVKVRLFVDHIAGYFETPAAPRRYPAPA
ncbi:MAG TPA: LysR family transcriptional regulator [Burkholderiaceae bacterium]|jgi:DNA-binding transcriptional LysR family regulator|nr:LysR family transcriptional regulator [Burkholderiaceae bacterium]